MDWQARYYPTDVFGGIAVRMDELVGAGRLVAPAIVREEVGVVGTADMAAWATARPRLFVPTADVLADAVRIENQFPGLRDPRSTYDEADAYVIALASQRDGIVVTQETSAAEKRNPKRTHFIPDVCRELGIPCIALLGLFRREGWSF